MKNEDMCGVKSEFRAVIMSVGDGWLSGGREEKEGVQIYRIGGRREGLGRGKGDWQVPDELLPCPTQNPVLNAAPVHLMATRLIDGVPITNTAAYHRAQAPATAGVLI